MDVTFALLIAAAAASGLLAGASLDQSIKQLPARHRLGVIAFSQYSRASDLTNGVAFYAVLGIGAAVLCISAAVSAYAQDVGLPQVAPIYASAIVAVLHSLVTGRAAPINFRQRKVRSNDAAALRGIFDSFSRWQTIRCVLQVISFAVSLWAVLEYRGV
jgi:hypothetical protein